VFPILHGPHGEDGTVQGLLECLDVPYVGAGVLASALCMDKLAFKDAMAYAGVPQVRYAAALLERWREDRDGVLKEIAELGLPVFVKPARLGSSIGIARVNGAGELAGALDSAFAHDPRVIVEAFAGSDVEVECSVIGHGEPIASEPGEIVLPGAGPDGWYDFEAKYSGGGMRLEVPARIAPTLRERVRELALEAFRRSGASGLARVDFFIAGDEVLVNELNTMPGFTETSVFARLFEASGVTYGELLERLAGFALERYGEEQAFRH
jgi:D-alanine-D-alanine ligase